MQIGIHNLLNKFLYFFLVQLSNDNFRLFFFAEIGITMVRFILDNPLGLGEIFVCMSELKITYGLTIEG